MQKTIEDLSNVFITLGELKVTGKEAYAMYMCMKTLEDSISKLIQMNLQEKECSKDGGGVNVE